MLDKLYEGLYELPKLLADSNNWDSLIVNPWTFRVYSKLSNGMRVCLHRFEICHTHEAFPHPHPWPGAFLVLEGSYKMEIGHSLDRESPMLDVMTTVMGRWSAYEIVNPLTWCAVIPLETTYTIMVNDTPKLFRVTKTESGWLYSNVTWVRYFVAATLEVVEAIV